MDITDKLSRFINEESDYQAFFNKKLKAYGVSSPSELSDEDKKKFYNEVDSEWKGKKETD